MKNIILIGACRSGKSTFTKLLNEKFNNLIIMRADILRLAFRDAIYKDESVSTSSISKNPDYLNYILSYYKYSNMYDIDYIKVLDTVDFKPKDCNLFENSIAFCFGFPEISKEEVVSNWKKYDTDLDWTKRKSDEELIEYAEREILNSKNLKQECEKYNIKFIDTSYDRDKVLNDLLEYVCKIYND